MANCQVDNGLCPAAIGRFSTDNQFSVKLVSQTARAPSLLPRLLHYWQVWALIVHFTMEGHRTPPSVPSWGQALLFTTGHGQSRCLLVHTGHARVKSWSVTNWFASKCLLIYGQCKWALIGRQKSSYWKLVKMSICTHFDCLCVFCVSMASSALVLLCERTKW